MVWSARMLIKSKSYSRAILVMCADMLGFGSVMNFLWGSPGTLRKMIPEWFAYFRPGFHPWDDDNRAELSRITPLISEIEDTAIRAGASTRAPSIRSVA